MRLNLSQNTSEQKLEQAMEQVQAAANAPLPKKAGKRQRMAPALSIPTLSENVPLNGYELRFAGPIPPELSAELRSKRWGFARFGSNGYDARWYAKRSPEQLAYIHSLIARLSGISSAVPVGQETVPIVETPKPAPIKAPRLLALIS